MGGGRGTLYKCQYGGWGGVEVGVLYKCQYWRVGMGWRWGYSVQMSIRGPGVGVLSVQMSIWGCAADVGRVFSNSGTFMGPKFTYFHQI